MKEGSHVMGRDERGIGKDLNVQSSSRVKSRYRLVVRPKTLK